MRHVRRDTSHLVLAPIESHREEPRLLPRSRNPVPLPNELAERLGLGLKCRRLSVAPEVAKYLGKLTPRAVGVALHLDHRDRPIGETPIGELDGVLGVLPALVAERAGPRGSVLQEPVVVTIAGATHPSQGGLRRWQKVEQCRSWSTPAKCRPVEDEKERRRVDGAVVGAGTGDRALAKPRPRGKAHLVENLPRFLVVTRLAHAPLTCGEGSERVHHLAGKEGPGLVPGDDAVATKEGDKPRYARGHKAPARLEAVGHAERAEIGKRPAAGSGEVRRMSPYVDRGLGTRPGRANRAPPGRPTVSSFNLDLEMPGLPATEPGCPRSAPTLK